MLARFDPSRLRSKLRIGKGRDDPGVSYILIPITAGLIGSLSFPLCAVVRKTR